MTAQGNQVLPAVPPLPASPGPSAAICASFPTEGMAETFQPELPWISIASLMEVISARRSRMALPWSVFRLRPTRSLTLSSW